MLGAMRTSRCVLGEHSIYFAEGLTSVLARTGVVRITSWTSSVQELPRLAAARSPDVVIVGFEPLARAVEVVQRATPVPSLILASPGAGGSPEPTLATAYRVVWKDAPLPELLGAIEDLAAGPRPRQSGRVTFADPLLGRGRKGPCGDLDPRLTPRERDVVQFVLEGRSSKQIARTLGIAEQTVKNHLHNVMTRVGASSRVQLCMWAMENGQAGRKAKVPPER